jgi:hypothetical protein
MTKAAAKKVAKKTVSARKTIWQLVGGDYAYAVVYLDKKRTIPLFEATVQRRVARGGAWILIATSLGDRVALRKFSKRHDPSLLGLQHEALGMLSDIAPRQADSIHSFITRAFTEAKATARKLVAANKKKV